jgi:ankyrin repeat protein
MRQDGATPLHVSAHNGHTETVLVLLQAGATVDAKREVRGALLSECMCVCFRIRV